MRQSIREKRILRVGVQLWPKRRRWRQKLSSPIVNLLLKVSKALVHVISELLFIPNSLELCLYKITHLVKTCHDCIHVKKDHSLIPSRTPWSLHLRCFLVPVIIFIFPILTLRWWGWGKGRSKPTLVLAYGPSLRWAIY